MQLVLRAHRLAGRAAELLRPLGTAALIVLGVHRAADTHDDLLLRGWGVAAQTWGLDDWQATQTVHGMALLFELGVLVLLAAVSRAPSEAPRSATQPTSRIGLTLVVLCGLLATTVGAATLHDELAGSLPAGALGAPVSWAVAAATWATHAPPWLIGLRRPVLAALTALPLLVCLALWARMLG